jgi:Family of unknown function (DUF5677)
VAAAAGHGREVPIVVRSALETLIIALFIAKKDSVRRAKIWGQHAELQKARILRKYPNLSSTPEHKKVRAKILAHAGRLKKLFPNPNAYPVDGRGVTYSYAFFSPKHLGEGQFYLMGIADEGKYTPSPLLETRELHSPPVECARVRSFN